MGEVAGGRDGVQGEGDEGKALGTRAVSTPQAAARLQACEWETVVGGVKPEICAGLRKLLYLSQLKAGRRRSKNNLVATGGGRGRSWRRN